MRWTLSTMYSLRVDLAKGLYAKLVQFINHEWSAHSNYIIYASDVVCQLVVYLMGVGGV